MSIHRAVLAASSPYLFELFDRSADIHSTETSLQHTPSMYKLKDVPFSVFSHLLDYMYTGRWERVPVSVRLYVTIGRPQIFLQVWGFVFKRNGVLCIVFFSFQLFGFEVECRFLNIVFFFSFFCLTLFQTLGVSMTFVFQPLSFKNSILCAWSVCLCLWESVCMWFIFEWLNHWTSL